MFSRRLFQTRSTISMTFCKTRSRRLYTGKREGKKPPWFMNLLEWDFLARNVLLPGFLMCISDLVEQQLENLHVWGEPLPKEEIDFERTARMTIVGSVMGPLQYVGYKYMDKWLPGYTLRIVFKKIIADQIIMSPLSIIIFFYAACFLEGRTFKAATAEMEHKFYKIYIMDWMFWPPVQFLNFRYLDPSLRVLYVNFATAIYNVMLSYVKHIHD